MTRQTVLSYLRTRRFVRPWALSAPVLILLICVPMLRPLRTPDPGQLSDDEQARLATVQAIVEHHTLAIEGTEFRNTQDRITGRSEIGRFFPAHFYSKQPPMLAVLLSGPYCILCHYGFTLVRDPNVVIFVLTLLGVTLPVALSAGLVYRMSRAFELKRPLRALLSFCVVVGSGLVSYATVLNAHAPAAALLLATTACFMHIIAHNHAGRSIAWLAMAGFFAALAATVDPPAMVFLPLLMLVVASFRWRRVARAAALAAYCLGALLPLAVEARLNTPITGDLAPGMFHPELAVTPFHDPAATLGAPDRLLPVRPAASLVRPLDEGDEESPGLWHRLGRTLYHVGGALIGRHGIFSHFPVVLLGVIGVTLIMRRHWPTATKMLAGATLAGAAIIILLYSAYRTDARDAMFATRWFIVFLPLTLFWAGAWLRRSHGQAAWALAGVLLAFSVMASLIGATGPLPRGGFDHYTLACAWNNFLHRPAPTPPILSPVADRGGQDAINE